MATRRDVRRQRSLRIPHNTSSKVWCSQCSQPPPQWTNVILRYMEYLLGPMAPAFPLDKHPSLRELCFSAIARFSRISLASSGQGFGPAALPRPLEAQYQNELYRACYAELGGYVYLTSEWTGTALSGRVDFQIKSVKWAIECVREGKNLEEHIARFQPPGGKYYKGVTSGEIRKYILLDFRTSMPKKARSMLFLSIWV
jgi:hypothetical protein